MRRLYLFAATAALLAGAGTATAQTPSQDEAVDVEDIVVTARRREERLADVPAAAAVIDAGAIADRGGASSVLDLLAGQAGVRFLNTSSPVTSEISVRASPTARATNADPSVGLYRNGGYIGGGAIGGRSFTRLDLFDLGRVEILRGTQGALYGRNAVGGAVNVVSAEPEFERSGFMDVRYAAETAALQVQAVANLPFGDSAALRLGVDWIDQSEGFFYNPTNDVYFDAQDTLGLRLQYRIANERTDVRFLAENQEGDVPAVTFRLSIAPQPGFPGGYLQPPFDYAWSDPPLSTQDLRTFGLFITHRLDRATLSSTTAFRSRDSYYQFDSDGITQADYLAARGRGDITAMVDTGQLSKVADSSDIFTQDIHATGDLSDGRLTWLAGIDYYSLESDSSVEQRRTPTVANPSVGTFSPATLTARSIATYGSLDYQATERLSLSAEGRVSRDERDIRARRFDAGTGAPLGGPGLEVDADRSSSNGAYNLVAGYDLSDDILGYAKIGTSYRSGGFNTNLGTAAQPVAVVPAYEDEQSITYEIGLKGSPVERVYFAAAAFWTETDDLITQTDNGCAVTNPVCRTAPVQFLTNAGEAEAWGVELETTVRGDLLGGRLRATFALSAQGGEIVSGPYSGRPLPQVPDWIAGVDVTYRRPIGPDREVFANVNYNGQWGGVQELIRPGAPNPNFDLADAEIVNARLGVTFGDIEASLFVNNLADEVFPVFQTTTTERLSLPRNWGVQLRRRW